MPIILAERVALDPPLLLQLCNCPIAKKLTVFGVGRQWVHRPMLLLDHTHEQGSKVNLPGGHALHKLWLCRVICVAAHLSRCPPFQIREELLQYPPEFRHAESTHLALMAHVPLEHLTRHLKSHVAPDQRTSSLL